MAKSDDLRLPWRNIGIGSMLLNLGAIGAVATIATVHDSNTLATVALALAIIAFICQLIIFSVQTWQSGEQLKQAERLNAETSGLLSEMRTRLEGTHQMVATQYEELLHLAVLKADATDAKTATVPAEQPSRRAALADIVREIMPTIDVEHAREVQPDGYRVGDALIWPGLQDARRAIELLNPLNDFELSTFMSDVSTDTLNRITNEIPRFEKTTIDTPLIEAGLVAGVLSGAGKEADKIQLTERGRIASRILIPEWPPPESLADLNDEIWSIRNRIDSRVSAMAERTREALKQHPNGIKLNVLF